MRTGQSRIVRKGKGGRNNGHSTEKEKRFVRPSTSPPRPPRTTRLAVIENPRRKTAVDTPIVFKKGQEKVETLPQYPRAEGQQLRNSAVGVNSKKIGGRAA